jgi:hypothetical protein
LRYKSNNSLLQLSLKKHPRYSRFPKRRLQLLNRLLLLLLKRSHGRTNYHPLRRASAYLTSKLLL